jgi:hypothetical protein
MSVAVPAFLSFAIRAPKIPGKIWATVLALVTALGLTQFVVENQVIPNRSRPKISLTAELTEVGHSGRRVSVRGVIEWTNNGLAETKIPLGFAVVTAAGREPGTFKPLDSDDAVTALNPVVADSQAFKRRLDSGRGERVIWFDDIAPVASLLPAGTSDRREFLLTLDRSDVKRLELRVSMTYLSGARLGRPETCDGSSNVNDQDFLDKAREPIENDEGWQFTCLRVPFTQRNIVRTLTDDSSSMLVGYAFEAPRPEFVGPFSYYQSEEDDPTDLDKLNRAAEAIDARNPSLIQSANAVLAIQREPSPVRPATLDR